MSKIPPLAVSGSIAERLGFWLFCSTGAALPLFAFPFVPAFGKRADAATVLAGAFVLAWAPKAWKRLDPATRAWLGCAWPVPLLALITAGWRDAPFAPRQFVVTYGHWLLLTAFFVAVTTLPLGRGDWRRFVDVQMVAASIVTLFCFYQLVGRRFGWAGTGHFISSFQRWPFRGGSFGAYERPTSFFLEPSYLGGYLTWASILAFCAAADRDSARRARWVYGMLLAAYVIAIVAAVSLGSFVDLAVLAVVSMVHTWRRGDRRHRAHALLAFCAAAGLVVLADAALHHGPARTVTIRAAESLHALREHRYRDLGTYRVGLHVRELQTARAHPITGVGLGQYPLVFASVPEHIVGTEQVVSGWLGAAAEMGIPGVLVIAASLLLARRHGTNLVVDLSTVFLVVNQLHFASYVELSFWYPLASCAVASRRGSPASGVP